MNFPSCQTTSQMRVVFTSLAAPSFANIFLTPFQSAQEKRSSKRETFFTETASHQANSTAFQSNPTRLFGTGHNSVNPFGLARRVSVLVSLDSDSRATYHRRALTLSKDCQSMQYSDRALQSAFTRWLLAISLVISAFLLANCRLFEKTGSKSASVSPERTTNPQADALAVHRRAIVMDMHADTPQRLVDESVDLAQRLSAGQLDAVQAKEGGLDAQFFSIWVEPQLFGGGGPGAIKRAEDQIAAVRQLADRHSETWQLATSSD